ALVGPSPQPSERTADQSASLGPCLRAEILGSLVYRVFRTGHRLHIWTVFPRVPSLSPDRWPPYLPRGPGTLLRWLCRSGALAWRCRAAGSSACELGRVVDWTWLRHGLHAKRCLVGLRFVAD